MNSLFISPHCDDETLFGAYTLMREKPLVVIVTDSYIQQNRGENITPQQRFQESVNAMKLLKCPIMRLGIRDDVIEKLVVMERLAWFKNFDKVYAPAIQGGNKDHDLIGEVAQKVFGDKLIQYCTYTKQEAHTTGKIPVEATEREVNLKNKALECYISQINLPSTKMYFEAVRGMNEWFM